MMEDLSVLGQLVEPRLVLRDRQARDGGGELRVGQVVGVVAAGGDQPVDQRVAVLGNGIDLIARVAHGLQQRDARGRRVEADRVADPPVLGREGGEHHHHLALRGRRGRRRAIRTVSAATRAQRSASGDVGRDALELRVRLLERHDAAEQAPVELRDRDLHRDVHRAQARGRLGPRGARAGDADRLDHRDAERGERVGAPRALVGGGRAAGGEHGDDQGIHVALERAPAPGSRRRRPAAATAPRRTSACRPPAATARASSSTNAVFPAARCER